jgi:DNA repair exonuclease SbcCD ATPase subunit
VIKFKSITFKNVLSYGNIPTTIELDVCGTSLITGANGCGKSSSLLDTLCYGLYGKAFRKINNIDLINRINNKAAEVEIVFDVNDRNYIVRRGMKPTKFDITVDGKPRNKDAAVRDQQDWLESVLGMNEKSFRQIVVLGSGNYIPFMQLSSNDRRKVIEQLLDIEIFSSMNVTLKEHVRIVKDSVKSTQHDYDILEREVDVNRKHINDNDVKRSVSLQKLDEEINKIDADIKKLNNENKELSSIDTSDIKGKIRKLTSIKSDVDARIKSNKSMIKIINNANGTCPTCTQSISESFKNSYISGSESVIDRLEEGKVEMVDVLDSMNDMLSVMELNMKKLSENETIIDQKLSLITMLKESDAITDDSKLKEDVKLKEDELKLFRRSLSKYNKTANHLSVIEIMLKDSGIKTRIIKKYLPVLNGIINKYLQVFEFNVILNLDETFNETITQNGRIISGYNNFSEGEKLRVDLAILFSFRELARVKNSANTNILILDETLDKSMDSTGVEHFLNIIREQDKSHIFVISHKDDMAGNFNRNINVTKDGQFSVLTETML